MSFSNAVQFLPGTLLLAMTINRIVSQNMYFFIPVSSPKVRELNPKSIGRRMSLFLGPLFERFK